MPTVGALRSGPLGSPRDGSSKSFDRLEYRDHTLAEFFLKQFFLLNPRKQTNGGAQAMRAILIDSLVRPERILRVTMSVLHM